MKPQSGQFQSPTQQLEDQLFWDKNPSEPFLRLALV